jgi:hypothetical protein
MKITFDGVTVEQAKQLIDIVKEDKPNIKLERIKPTAEIAWCEAAFEFAIKSSTGDYRTMWRSRLKDVLKCLR